MYIRTYAVSQCVRMLSVNVYVCCQSMCMYAVSQCVRMLSVNVYVCCQSMCMYAVSQCVRMLSVNVYVCCQSMCMYAWLDHNSSDIGPCMLKTKLFTFGTVYKRGMF